MPSSAARRVTVRVFGPPTDMGPLESAGLTRAGITINGTVERRREKEL